MMSEEPTFKLEIFDGPLDLLLHLVQKNKINIENIPIAEITGQYLEYIDLMQSMDIEITSEFLVMAAQLLLIKSRMLLPVLTEDEPDPREDLQEKLAEYKKIKEAAKILESTQFSTIENYFKASENIGKAPIENKKMPVEKLLDAFYEILKREIAKAPPTRENFNGIIQHTRIPIEKKLDTISLLIKHKRKILFEDIFENSSSKDELIVSFLAVLQLVSKGKIFIQEENNNIFLTNGDFK